MEKQEQNIKEQRIRKITQMYYARKDIQKALFEFSKNREIAPSYMMESFGKRPDSFQYPGDVFELVKNGATSFHCSEELWEDPLKLSTEMNEKQLDELRIGWDLLLDIDSKYLDYSKILAEIIIKILRFYGVKNFGIKFSGNKGFHMIVPWKAFPKEINNIKTADMFPEWPRILTKFIMSASEKELIEKITLLTTSGLSKYVKDFKAPKEVMPDLILVSPRHLFRMPYSVDFDEPIIVKNKGKIEVVKIGEFADKFYNTHGSLQIKDVSNTDYETLSFNLAKNETRFNKITNLIRHKINEKLFRIELESGRKVKVTSGHSLFILNEGKIQTIKGDKVKKGDYLVTLRKLTSPTRTKNELIVSEELIDKDLPCEKRNIFLCDFDKKIFDNIYNLNIPGRKKTLIYNWKVYNILPLDVYEVLIKKYPYLKEKFKDANIKMSRHGGPARKVPNKIRINKKLMRLLGYYISEGCCDKNRDRVYFSFGSHEKELIEDCANILKSLKLKPNLRKPHKTAVQIEINSNILKIILKKLFCCGDGARNKRVPSIIWQVNENLKKEFLHSYILGDGHLEKKWAKLIIFTASKRLQKDLCFLLGFLGIGYSLNMRHVTRWVESSKEQYIFIIQGKKDVEELGFKTNSKIVKESLTNRFPIKQLGLEKSILESRWRNQYIKNKIISRNRNFIKKLNPSKEILSLIKGDASFIRVKDIREIKSKNQYVYDLSVKKDENFIGGNCILLHNSLHEKTALASMVIIPEKFKDFQPKDANPLKVKVRDFILNPVEGEASEFLREALDWYKIKKPNELIKTEKREFKPIQIGEFSEEIFPPAIKKILQGVNDGRKRSLFILLNLFRSAGMDKDEIDKRISEWNEKNTVPLKKGYIKSQLLWSYRNKVVPPPNYDKDYYKGIGIIPTEEELRYKNPINYMAKKSRQKDTLSKSKRKIKKYKKN